MHHSVYGLRPLLVGYGGKLEPGSIQNWLRKVTGSMNYAHLCTTQPEQSALQEPWREAGSGGARRQSKLKVDEKNEKRTGEREVISGQTMPTLSNEATSTTTVRLNDSDQCERASTSEGVRMLGSSGTGRRGGREPDLRA